MAKTKQQKKNMLDKFGQGLEKSKASVFVNFSGIPVKEIDQLRQKCKEAGAEYLVTKKTLLKKTLTEKGLVQDDSRQFEGEIATVFGYEDEVAPAKLVSEFAKSHDNMKILGGILENGLIDEAKVKALSVLPAKEELLAKLVGSLAAPMSGLVNVLQGNIRGLVYALNALKDKKQ